jgi:hypothetical protein
VQPFEDVRVGELLEPVEVLVDGGESLLVALGLDEHVDRGTPGVDTEPGIAETLGETGGLVRVVRSSRGVAERPGEMRIRPRRALWLAGRERSLDPTVDLSLQASHPHAGTARRLEGELAVDLGPLSSARGEVECVLHRRHERLPGVLEGVRPSHCPPELRLARV